MDPLRELFPVHEREPTPPKHAECCPACRKPLQFTHYESTRVPIGEFVAIRVELAELFALALLAAVGAIVAFYAGILIAILALAVLAALVYVRDDKRLRRQAVWFCRACDRYRIGRRLAAWKAGSR
jgi:hypothetical protein